MTIALLGYILNCLVFIIVFIIFENNLDEVPFSNPYLYDQKKIAYISVVSVLIPYLFIFFLFVIYGIKNAEINREEEKT